MRVKIGSRQSDLARIQAYRVAEALKKADPKAEIQFCFKESLGDKNLTDPLWKMPEKGVFTEDFYQDLLEEKVDLVVHSFKDLPTEPRVKTEIVATLERADQRDLLLVKKSHLEKIKKSKMLKVYSSSPRRAYNLKDFFLEALPFELIQVDFLNVRGNIPTRLKKLLEAAEADGLVLAKAAVDRLLSAHEPEFLDVQKNIRMTLNKCLWCILPLSVNPSAAAQGALAIEIKAGRKDIADLVQKIHQPEVFQNVLEERKILASYGGGCHQKIGVNVIQKSFGRVMSLKGLTDAGETLCRYARMDDQKNNLNQTPVLPSKNSIKKIWPSSGESPQLFDREMLQVEMTEDHKKSDLFITRDTALPENWNISPYQFVFTSGVETWRRLAKRGVWVSGTCDSLGEDLSDHTKEEMSVFYLLGRKPRWKKLTHTSGYESVGSAEIIPTYQLISKKEVPDFSEVTHFFWMSGSSFLRAKELYPQIIKAHHSCGPGNTLKIIQEYVPEVSVFLNIEEWRKTI